LPKILQIIMMAIATKATIQERPALSPVAEQLLIADGARIRPIAIIIGPVTIGGKNLITLCAPNPLNNAERMKYSIAEHATPKQA
jgi:hypothetical protein